MGKALVIVESPAKAKTINKFLGRNFIVKASMGHVRDLPKRNLGVNEETFEPEYAILPDKKKTLAELKRAAKGADAVYLASDPDREGEAICWHLKEELQKSTDAEFHRVMFNEITKKAILAAFEHPIEIDIPKVEAQQARRILDRLVGYKISPLLWEKVRRGLSAGRVQSVALRMICEREREVAAFKTREYWSMRARLAGETPPEFNARLVAENGKKIELVSKDEIVDALGKIGWEVADVVPTDGGHKDAITVEVRASSAGAAPFKVTDVQARQKKKNPLPPFITSKLQQDAARQLGYPVAKTMRMAQGLYEGREIGSNGVVGLITYMRTDSTRVSDDAISSVREYIATTYGKDKLPEKPRAYKVAKQAQEAHEAIRPTSTEFSPEVVKKYLGADEFKLYCLIWSRFVASQMNSAIFDVTRADISAGPYTFRANGSVLKSPGFLAVYHEALDPDKRPKEGEDDSEDAENRLLPELKVGQELDLKTMLPKQHFTQPPPRYSEASLVKALEENGIGRPSTYASILSTIRGRDYVSKEGKRFLPTELGMLVNDLMVASFGDIVDIGYTARMEEELDRIEEGTLGWIDALKAFQKKFEVDLAKAKTDMRDVKREAIPTDQKCDKCGKTMVLKWGRFGQFLACSGYPDCKNTRDLGNNGGNTADRSDLAAAAKTAMSAAPDPIETEAEPCEKCGKPMVLRRGRYGQFLACSGYPDCKTTRKVTVSKDGKTEAKADVMLDDDCPRCGNKLALKQGRYGEFTACSNYPTCRYIKMKETGVPCPECGKGQVVERRSKRGKVFFGCDQYPDCSFVLWKRPVNKACPQCDRTYMVEKNTKKNGREYICESENCGHTEPAETAEA